MVRNKLSGNWSFVARFLRLIPLTWNAWPCLRMEVYGRGKILHLFHDYKQIKMRHYNQGGTNETINVVEYQWAANVIVEDLGPNLLGAIGDQIQEISGNGAKVFSSRDNLCLQCAHSYFDWLSELPAIDVRFPRNKTVLEGEQFTLRCLLLGNKNHFNVTWMKKSGNERSFPVAGQNLTVNATRLDTGAYSCEVTNGVEAIVSPIAYVTVWCKCIDQGF